MRTSIGELSTTVTSPDAAWPRPEAAWTGIVLQDPAPPSAQDPQVPPPESGSASPFGNMLWPMLAILVVFWVVMLGPERKNRKRREAMLTALKKGDRVMTSSGIYGTVTQLQDNVVTLAIADGVRVRFSRQAIQSLEEERASEDRAGDQPAKEKGG